jgi:ATP-binding cassette subfamily B protein
MFVVFLIIRNVFQGKLLIGTFVSYLRAVNLTHHNSVQVLNQIFLLYQNNLYISNLFEFFSIKVSEPNKSAEHEITSIEKIAFVNVYFKYPGSQEYALENISFTINKAENIAIVGENGSGKTTIVKLLTGLYEVEAGKIYLNDLDIKVIKKQSLQKNIGILLQDFVKYQLSLRENVGLGELDLINSDKALINALDKSGGASILSSLTNGLNQQLGCWFDNGTELSTGQWQKIALARAFLRDASLYILDEPSSALDPLSEKELFQKFKDLVAGKMGIYISHRFSTVKFASKIIVLKKGKIIEVGNHFELMKQNKYYAEIYNVQKEPYLDD